MYVCMYVWMVDMVSPMHHLNPCLSSPSSHAASTHSSNSCDESLFVIIENGAPQLDDLGSHGRLSQA